MKAAHLRGELAKASGDEFCNLVHSYLQAVLPESALTRRLGELDRQGMDIIQYRDSSFATSTAIQCKGYERPFHSREVPNLKKEIKKFERLGPTVDAYWLVLNRPIESKADRAEIEAELKELVISGKAGWTRLLDLEGILVTLGDLAMKQIAAWSAASQTKLLEDYRERLQVVRYISDVPYRLHSVSLNPVRLLCDTTTEYFRGIDKSTTGKNRKPPRFLLTGSFGFGKTSTVHALATEWLRLGKSILYTPAALLDERAFTHTKGLSEEVLRLIHPDQGELSDAAMRLFTVTLKKHIARSSDWLMIIDGLDESPCWENRAQLSALWGSLTDLGLPFVTTVREELYLLRQSELEGRGTPKHAGRFLEVVTLLDWPDHLILEFLERYAAERDAPTPEPFRRLTELVKEGAYETHYGDIPKRPLFLGMLAEDAWEGRDPDNKLHRLYGKYLRRKIEGDRWSAGAMGKTVRQGPFSDSFGFDEGTERMIRAMQALAGALLDQASDSSVSSEGISLFDEKLLSHHMAEEGVAARAEEVVLNSLIQPAGRDSFSGRRLFRFAHKSFQEWFAARFLVRHGDPYSVLGSQSDATRRFAQGMIEDVASDLPLP